MSKHLKIALVDDDIPNTEVLRDFLIRNGYSHVDKYHDGESFLESLDRFDERAVVLDFDLSGGGDLNGLEVLEAVKATLSADSTAPPSCWEAFGSAGCRFW